MKALFLGNRPLVREVCQKRFYTKVIETPKGIDKKTLFELLADELDYGFDLLVSNGCPWLLPIDWKNSAQKWVNVHPSWLPDYKGTSPIKAMDKDNIPYVAATCHFIDEGMDTGNIIYRESQKFMGTLDERYKASFELEAKVFNKAMDILRKDYYYEGVKQ